MLQNRARRVGVRPQVELLETRELPSAGIPIQSFHLPKGTNFPDHLTVGADKNIWFSNGLASKVGFITPGGKSHVFSTAKVSSHGLDGLTLGPDKNIWFVELFDNKIGNVTRSGKIHSFTLPEHGPDAITTGPDRNLWVTSFDNYVGKVTTSGQVTWFQHTGPEHLNGIISFAGALWLREEDQIGRVGTDGTFTDEFQPPHHGKIADITVGPGNKLWFTENVGGGHYLGSLSASGRIQEFKIGGGKDLGHLAGGSDGNLYVRQGDNLLRVTPGGKVTAHQNLGFIAGDGSTVKGPGGTIWYAEGVLDRIGRARV